MGVLPYVPVSTSTRKTSRCPIVMYDSAAVSNTTYHVNLPYQAPLATGYGVIADLVNSGSVARADSMSNGLTRIKRSICSSNAMSD